jgi:outer membrane receptor protein involved in Fe transport
MAYLSKLITAGTLALLPPRALADGTQASGSAPAAPTAATPASPTVTENIVVTAQRLAKARSEIQTRIGATTYTLSSKAIQKQPGGDDVPLNQTLLQTPGVSQDSYGQIHLRNDHANIQYRIDGVILPEGISFFGQSLTSRFAASIDLITGTLPAQYGLVTSGIVDIQTKAGAFDNGGSIGIYGGSRDWLEPSIEYAGSRGNLNFYFAGDYVQNDIGIENPTSSTTPLHDNTQQGHGFGYLEDIIDPTSKVTAIFGVYQGAFQIPDNPDQPPAFALGNQTYFNSALLNESQTESNDYGILSYLKAEDDYSFQVSAFERYSRLAYTPDHVGDLLFYGLAQNATRSDVAEGLQADGSYKLGDAHTLRFGVLVTGERATASTSSEVFPCLVADCSSVGTSPVHITDGSGETGLTYSAYLQDEFRLLPSLTLNYGLRYDILNAYTDTQQLSPRVNLVWKPDADTGFHAGYSRYFTPPSLENISGQAISKFAGTTGYPAGYTPANPPLDSPILPERSNYFDVGAEHVFFRGFKLGVDGYWKIARDLIDEGQFGAPIILSVFNFGHANVLGIEFTGSYDVGNFSAYGNLSIGRERANQLVTQQFNFAPDDLAYLENHYIYTDHSQFYTASAGASYNLHGTHLNADFIYGTGLREDATDPQTGGNIPNGGAVAPYFQLNLGVTHRFEDVFGAPLELTGSIINVTDRSYEIRSGSGVGVFAPQYGPRREFFAGIRKFF